MQVMRALGLGVIIEVGPGSQFNVGDNVSGIWGGFNTILFRTLK